MARIDIVDRQILSRWIEGAYPRLTTEVIYGGIYFKKKSDSPSWIFLRNDRTVVSYNAETGRTHRHTQTPRGRGWMFKLQRSLQLRFERLWGEKMELPNG